MKIVNTILAFMICCVAANAADPSQEPELRTFVEKHCVQCHGPDKQEGDVRLDNLPLTGLSVEQLETWKLAIEQVTALDMPPEDDLALSDEMIASFERLLKPVITRGLASVDQERVVLRRLNKTQYSNTVRDLFGINIEVEDPARSLPPDETAEGFDNIGSALSISNLHMDAYLAAAEDVLTRWEKRAKAEPNLFRLQAPAAAGDKKISFGNGVVDSGTHYDLLHSAWTNRRFKTMVFPAKNSERSLLPHGGVYRITVDAETLHTDDPAGYELIKETDLGWEPTPDQKPGFGFFLRRPARDITPNIDQRVATFEMEHGQRKTMTVETWLPGGQYTLAVNFDTGPRFDPNQAAARFELMAELTGDPTKLEEADLQKHRELKKEERTEFFNQLMNRTTEVRKDKEVGPRAKAHFASLPLPRIRFHSITIEGPLADPNAPTPAYLKKVETDSKFQSKELAKFARKAFRRPVSNDELAPYLAYAGDNGFRAALKALICSPNFLYLRETEETLNDYALAARLSYFLWNSMPDEELFELASVGKLRNETVLREQLTRMLTDRKARSFIDRFAHQWLAFDNMDDMPASRDFEFFHDFFVKDLMREETSLFLYHLFKTNAPVSDLVHADYTFLNSALARHYGVDGVHGSAFRKVSLNNVPERRGLLGQGSVLTTSANGIDTSPVVRGIWVLENLLGTPPSPPPPDVEVLEPDTRGTKTIREMYAVHRTNPSCNRCHEDIDPLGFALENFNPIGQWRDKYESGLPIDSKGQMPGGRQFDDIVGLRELMHGSATDLVARHLLTQLLVCASGRELTVADDAEIQSILKAHAASGHRLGDLLFATIKSEIFTTK